MSEDLPFEEIVVISSPSSMPHVHQVAHHDGQRRVGGIALVDGPEALRHDGAHAQCFEAVHGLLTAAPRQSFFPVTTISPGLAFWGKSSPTRQVPERVLAHLFKLRDGECLLWKKIMSVSTLSPHHHPTRGP